MAITATYTVTLSASDKDHAKGEYVYASIVRTSPATLVPEGLYVQSATIDMTGITVLLAAILLCGFLLLAILLFSLFVCLHFGDG